MAAWLCVVVVAVALARACSMLAAAAHRARMENPTEQDVDAVLANMEEHHGQEA